MDARQKEENFQTVVKMAQDRILDFLDKFGDSDTKKKALKVFKEYPVVLSETHKDKSYITGKTSQAGGEASYEGITISTDEYDGSTSNSFHQLDDVMGTIIHEYVHEFRRDNKNKYGGGFEESAANIFSEMCINYANGKELGSAADLFENKTSYEYRYSEDEVRGILYLLKKHNLDKQLLSQYAFGNDEQFLDKCVEVLGDKFTDYFKEANETQTNNVYQSNTHEKLNEVFKDYVSHNQESYEDYWSSSRNATTDLYRPASSVLSQSITEVGPSALRENEKNLFRFFNSEYNVVRRNEDEASQSLLERIRQNVTSRFSLEGKTTEQIYDTLVDISSDYIQLRRNTDAQSRMYVSEIERMVPNINEISTNLRVSRVAGVGSTFLTGITPAEINYNTIANRLSAATVNLPGSIHSSSNVVRPTAVENRNSYSSVNPDTITANISSTEEVSSVDTIRTGTVNVSGVTSGVVSSTAVAGGTKVASQNVAQGVTTKQAGVVSDGSTGTQTSEGVQEGAGRQGEEEYLGDDQQPETLEDQNNENLSTEDEQAVQQDDQNVDENGEQVEESSNEDTEDSQESSSEDKQENKEKTSGGKDKENSSDDDNDNQQNPNNQNRRGRKQNENNGQESPNNYRKNNNFNQRQNAANAADKAKETAEKGADAAKKADQAKKAADSAKKVADSAKKAKDATKAAAKNTGNDLKSKLLMLFKAHPVAFLIAIAVILILVVIIIVIITMQLDSELSQSGGIQEGSYGMYSGAYSNNQCMPVSIRQTQLSRQEFIDKVNAYGNTTSEYAVLKRNAGHIYDVSVANNFNPELVIVRAVNEGFDPGTSSNNYWGLGCCNNCSSCNSYSSLDEGLLAFFEYFNRLSLGEDSIYNVMSTYVYIGSYWYATYCKPNSPNSDCSDKGGCYYQPYISPFMSSTRASETSNICANSSCMFGSSVGCTATTDEDQQAYTKWQVDENITATRKAVFGLDADTCDSRSGRFKGTLASNVDFGVEVVNYAIETFDSYSYSQPYRQSEGYVDCSSMVSRTYAHFGITLYDPGYYDDTGGEYRWCEAHGKLISEEELIPGDLIFWTDGNRDHYGGTHHVALYVGVIDGVKKQFAAHTDRYDQPDQVSVSNYNSNGDLFCRPSIGESVNT